MYACVCVLLVDKLLGRRFSNSGCRVLIPVLGCQVVQAGGDVLAVVVHLFTVEGALAVKTAEGLSQFHQLCLSTLPVEPLVANVLRDGARARVKHSSLFHAQSRWKALKH